MSQIARADVAPDRLVSSSARFTTLALCFMTSVLEGADILSMSFAAPRLQAEFAYSPNQIAIILAVALAGLMAGSAMGGRLSDRIGRKKVLIGSIIALGIFSLLTVAAQSFGALVAIRFLTGVGLGGAFPMLIAIASEASDPRFRARGVSIMYCGQPIGGVLLGLIVASGGEGFDWRTIFYIGGFGPLLLVPLLMLFLPETHVPRKRAAAGAPMSVTHALFADGRAPITMLLWVGYVCTLVAVYVINTWLPSLMIGKGFSRADAATITSIENMGAAIGCLVLARLMDRGHTRPVVLLTYAGMVGSLAALALLNDFTAVAAAAAVTGFFIIGGQFVLYALTPRYYAEQFRGTGVGVAVAVGRIGAIGGPLLAGLLVSAGMGTMGVVIAVVPAVGVAGLAIYRLVSRY